LLFQQYRAASEVERCMASGFIKQKRLRNGVVALGILALPM
jgi:hypothetical protein